MTNMAPYRTVKDYLDKIRVTMRLYEFLDEELIRLEFILPVAAKVLKEWNLKVNESKTKKSIPVLQKQYRKEV